MSISQTLRTKLFQLFGLTGGNELVDHLGVSDVTPGTVEASKALVVGASKELATLGSITITTLTAGTINVSAMPTSDPSVAGALYNDSGTIKISSG